MDVFEYNPSYLKRVRVISFVFIGIALLLSVTSIGAYKRDEKIIEDAKSLISIVGNEKAVKVSDGVYNKWNFQFYVLRLGDISFYPSSNSSQLYFIEVKNSKNTIPAGYSRVEKNFNECTLYRLQK